MTKVRKTTRSFCRPPPSRPQNKFTPMRSERRYYIYMLTCISRRALYTGITNSIPCRLLQHRNSSQGFTADYQTFRLVHYELFFNVRNAIAREKEIKGWTREKKNHLILESNPSWRDLAADFGMETWPPKPLSS
jgi:putative endonuclease